MYKLYAMSQNMAKTLVYIFTRTLAVKEFCKSVRLVSVADNLHWNFYLA